MFIIIIIIIIIIITFVITSMQAIYNYIPETNHVSIVYSVAAVLYLVCATRNDKRPVRLHLHFPQFVRTA